MHPSALRAELFDRRSLLFGYFFCPFSVALLFFQLPIKLYNRILLFGVEVFLEPLFNAHEKHRPDDYPGPLRGSSG